MFSPPLAFLISISLAGVYGDEVPPVPLPNTEVKLIRVDDTWPVAAWKIRSMPAFLFFADSLLNWVIWAIISVG